MNFDRIVEWCAPWNDLFSHSSLISGTVVGLHIMALVIGGGLALAADRVTLRVAAGDAAARRAQLREVRAVHTIVLGGVIVLFASGVALTAADVETFLPSPIFWMKLVLSLLLVTNGALLTRSEQRFDVNGRLAEIDDHLWKHVRLLSMSSAFLWVATAVVGIVPSNAA